MKARIFDVFDEGAPAVALTGLGLGASCVGRVVGVTKSFQTPVGAGPFPTEVTGDQAIRLRGTGQQPWDEYGTTTGRPRRVGWLDMVLLRYATRINGLTELPLTKLDILSGLPVVPLCIAYRKGEQTYSELPLGPNHLSDYTPIYEELPGWQEDLRAIRHWENLPAAARAYILRIEDMSGVPVRLTYFFMRERSAIQKRAILDPMRDEVFAEFPALHRFVVDPAADVHLGSRIPFEHDAVGADAAEAPTVISPGMGGFVHRQR